MPIYKLTVSTEMVVEAKDSDEAMLIAEQDCGRAIRDAEPDVVLHGQVNSLDDLPPGWDGECLAYGYSSRERTLKEILAP